MPPKKNPLKLNKLQLRTLALAQLLAQDPSLASRDEATGVVTVLQIPHAHGGFFTVMSPTVAEYYGLQAHGAIFGFVLFFGTIGGAAGPILAGRIFDLMGSYDPAFATLAALATLGLVLVLRLPSSHPGMRP